MNTKLLSRAEAVGYVAHKVAMDIKDLPADELCNVFYTITGEQLVLVPEKNEGEITDVSGNKLSSGPKGNVVVESAEEDAGSVETED